MRLIELKLVAVLICIHFTFSSVSLANESCYRGENNTALIFYNGMFSSEKDVIYALNTLRQKTNNQYKKYDYAYNLNETILVQLLEVFYQKAESDRRFVWTFFSELNGPKWFTELATKIASSVTANSYINDENLRSQVNLNSKYLAKNLGIVVVSHSQGNFYANNSYEYLSKEKTSDKLKMEIVGVASPDSYVAGNGEYRTLASDFIIRPIPNALPSNVSNDNPGTLDHEFLNHYLYGFPSGQQIMELISDATKKLNNNEYFFEPGYLHISLEKMDKWVKKLSKNLVKRNLAKYECLAVSIFLKNENWFGESCEDRSLDRMREVATACLDKEWSDSNHVTFNCGLYGLDSFFSPWRSAASENLVFKMHPECRWKTGVVHKEINNKILNKAFVFIQNPY